MLNLLSQGGAQINADWLTYSQLLELSEIV